MSGTVFAPDFVDQTGIFDPAKFVDEVCIIGAGGIGACTLPTLSTMGIPRVHLWDPDAVEPRNVATQLLYCPEDVTRPKVQVAAERLKLYGITEVVEHQEYFESAEHGHLLEGVVISAVDSMKVRQDIWRGVKDNALVTCLIDGRIGGEVYTLIVVDSLNDKQVEWYEQFQLYNDDEAAPLPCTERAVVYPAVALGAHIAATFAKLQRGDNIPWFRQENMRTGEVLLIEGD